jgi:predicted GNAT family acetyltransferase
MKKENLKVTHDKANHRFEIDLNNKKALIQYKKQGEHTLNLFHTEVPKEFEGKGVGSQLVKQTLEQIKAEGKKIVPSCPFVAIYIKRHPEYNTMVKE